MLNKFQYFTLDKTFINFDYFYFSKITIPIDFYLFQSGLDFLRVTIFNDEFDLGTDFLYYFNLGSPSAFDLEQEINLFFQAENLLIECQFNRQSGKFTFNSQYYNFDFDFNEKTNKIFGEIVKQSNVLINTQFICDLIFHQQLTFKTDLQMFPSDSDIEIINQNNVTLNLQSYNIFDFPEIKLDQQQFIYNKSNYFYISINYFDNFLEDFIKQSKIPISFEITFTKKDEFLSQQIKKLNKKVNNIFTIIDNISQFYLYKNQQKFTSYQEKEEQKIQEENQQLF